LLLLLLLFRSVGGARSSRFGNSSQGNVNELETGWEEVVWPEQWLNRNHHQHLKKKVQQEQHRSS
jgi:hypothetical protein